LFFDTTDHKLKKERRGEGEAVEGDVKKACLYLVQQEGKKKRLQLRRGGPSAQLPSPRFRNIEGEYREKKNCSNGLSEIRVFKLSS